MKKERYNLFTKNEYYIVIVIEIMTTNIGLSTLTLILSM